jgi:hypothetical protein
MSPTLQNPGAHRNAGLARSCNPVVDQPGGVEAINRQLALMIRMAAFTLAEAKDKQLASAASAN